MNDLQLIQQLSNARGASGFEDEVIKIARDYCADFANFSEDSMRNLCIYPKYNKGNRPLVMLDAHADEVGFMVQAIKPDGTLRFVPIGFWNVNALRSGKVQVYTETGYISGVIAATPPHLLTAEQRNAPPSYADLAIDIGASSVEEALGYGVKIGAPVVPLSIFEYEERHGILHGKAFDDRLGAAVMLMCLNRLQSENIAADVIGVLSSQEEVGERGIRAVMNNVKPDAAICFEGCPADDTSAPPYMVQDKIRGGAMIRHMDNTVICTPRFVKLALDVAGKNNIKVQAAVRSGGGNNGATIINSNGGTPVIVAGVPVRYIHSFNCLAALEDVYSNVELGVALLKVLDDTTIKSF